MHRVGHFLSYLLREARRVNKCASVCHSAAHAHMSIQFFQPKGRKLSNVTVMGVGKFSSGGLVVLLQEMSNPGGPFKRISFFMVILYNFICMKNPISFSNRKNGKLLAKKN